jgi:hypothetical protein
MSDNYHGTDFSYCGVKQCQNKCGRKLIVTEGLHRTLDIHCPGWNERMIFSNFCDENGEPLDLKQLRGN